MAAEPRTYLGLTAASFLEYAFLRWVLAPAVRAEMVTHVTPQEEITVGTHRYRTDYAISGRTLRIAVELDGFTFHGRRDAFSYDRLRQNDLLAAGWSVLRFSYDTIRTDAARCVQQLQALLAADEALAPYVVPSPVIERPEMDPDPLYGLETSFWRVHTMPQSQTGDGYFGTVRHRINLKTLRDCQSQAFTALGNYFRSGGRRAACVMSVGAGKTALGVAAALAFTDRRALVITPGSVIRGTFDKAFDHETVGNALYGLPSGPLIPGCRPPRVRVLDSDEGSIRSVGRDELLAADVIVTNFHSLGTGQSAEDLLVKLRTDDIDLVIVDEAHIAAADSYQRALSHFQSSRAILMSACFQRLDGRPIEADVVYRYRLIDSIADGNAKNLRVQRFAPQAEQTTYEMVRSDGLREEIVGREALVALLRDERKLARITAKSDASIRQVMATTRRAMEFQAELLYPVKPRVLFSAMGERHAEQVARIAEEHGIPTQPLHHTMSAARIRAVRDRFEQDSGDLQGIVQLKMLGQGYDFPPITVVVPMRPYGSFGEFYQFIGRGIRVLQHPALLGRVGPNKQILDIVYHAELGLDEHIETIYRENDMDPSSATGLTLEASAPAANLPGTRGGDDASQPETFVLFELGAVEDRLVHDQARIDQRKAEREHEALAQRYAAYAQATESPATFEQFVQLMRLIENPEQP